MKLLFCTVFALVLVSAYGQYDDSDSDTDNDVNQGNGNSGQSVYAYVPPSKSCARVYYGRSHCGGFTSGNGGGCDAYCLQNNYPLSYCRRTHCLCHRGEDLGRECEEQGSVGDSF